MEFVIYTTFVIVALFMASELNTATPQPQAQPVPVIAKPKTMPAATATPARMVIKSEDYARIASQGFEQYVNARTITAAPIEWHLFGLRELRQIAKALGVKGFGRMNTATVKAAIEAAIK